MKLLEFPHSHFCEKARWVLDYKGLPYKAVPVMPGFHMLTVRKYAAGTSVPVLLDGLEVVQGSAEIIDYLERQYPEKRVTARGKGQQAEALKFEKRMDRLLGESIRTILYQDLIHHPDFICYCFSHSMPKPKQWMVRMLYPLLRKRILANYVRSDKNVAQAKEIFAKAMFELETRLNQRKFTFGDNFTRTDIAIASMLSFISMPKQHPFPWMNLPEGSAKDFVQSYQAHPVIKWVEEMYREYR